MRVFKAETHITLEITIKYNLSNSDRGSHKAK